MNYCGERVTHAGFHGGSEKHIDSPSGSFLLYYSKLHESQSLEPSCDIGATPLSTLRS